MIPHGHIDHARRWRLAQEFTRPALVARSEQYSGDLPPAFGPIWCDAPGVAITAWFRETSEVGRGLEAYAGAAIEYPNILRFVELNGEATSATLRVPGQVGAAFRTNLLGEITTPLHVSIAEPPHAGPLHWSAITIDLQPYEIATVYLDVEMGRKVARDLDSYRSVWATVHRV
jgi:alpha-mannosidase